MGEFVNLEPKPQIFARPDRSETSKRSATRSEPCPADRISTISAHSTFIASLGGAFLFPSCSFFAVFLDISFLS
jgi:hypothetical protein